MNDTVVNVVYQGAKRVGLVALSIGVGCTSIAVLVGLHIWEYSRDALRAFNETRGKR